MESMQIIEFFVFDPKSMLCVFILSFIEHRNSIAIFMVIAGIIILPLSEQK